MSKKIIWVHGEKGGVGKSMMASVAIDWLLSNGYETCVVDGDGSFPDVFNRYENDSRVLIKQSPLVSASSVLNMLENLELAFKSASDNHTLVVNLPANTSVLDDDSATVLALTEALGYENYTMYMVADGTESKRTAIKSMKDGIVSISKRSVAVLNEYFVSDEGSDKSWENSTEEALWKNNGNVTAKLPVLNERVKLIPNFADESFEYLVHKDGNITKINAILINQWLREAYKVMEALECFCSTDEGVMLPVSSV